MTEVLAKDNEFFCNAIVFILKQLDIVDTLLQLLVVLFLKRIDIEHEEVAIVAADPGEIVMNSTTEKPMTTGLFHNNGAQVLVIHVQLVALAPRKDHA